MSENIKTKKIIAPLISPVLGILPAIFFVLASCFFPYSTALATGILTSIAYIFFQLLFLKQPFPYTFKLTVCAFILLVLGSFFDSATIFYAGYVSVIFEMLMIFAFALFYFSKSYFRKKIDADEKKRHGFDFDSYVIKTFLYLLVAHLLIILVYRLLPAGIRSPLADKVIYFGLFFIFSIAFFVFEHLNIRFLQQNLKKEIWLPIVNEHGGVHGKIAASVSKELKNKYQHPVVRIIPTYKGRIFLSERKEEHQLDYPFEADVLYQETLDDAAKRTFLQKEENAPLPYRFIFKYTFQNDNINRLVYLYSCHITDENELKQLNLPCGKWWTSKQIEENLGKGVFSDRFEQEFDFVNSTILCVERMFSV